MSLSLKTKLNFERQWEFIWEEKRLASYKSWVFSDDKVCSKQKMAEAGFVFVGNRYEKDAVKCFMCDKALDGWDEDDDPWSEHLKHSKNCAFAKLQVPEDAMTLQQFLKMKDELTITLLKKTFQEKKDELDAAFDNIVESLEERCNS